MAFPSWAPLWSKIVDSSVWREDPETRVVWITLLALKDYDHVVRYNSFQLSVRSNIPQDKVIKALEVLSNPDTKRMDDQQFEGRRIKKVDEGWMILNGDLYQKLVKREMKRAADRARMRDNRKAAAMSAGQQDQEPPFGGENE